MRLGGHPARRSEPFQLGRGLRSGPGPRLGRRFLQTVRQRLSETAHRFDGEMALRRRSGLPALRPADTAHPAGRLQPGLRYEVRENRNLQRRPDTGPARLQAP